MEFSDIRRLIDESKVEGELAAKTVKSNLKLIGTYWKNEFFGVYTVIDIDYIFSVANYQIEYTTHYGSTEQSWYSAPELFNDKKISKDEFLLSKIN